MPAKRRLHTGRSDYELRFLIRPYKGLTASLRDAIRQEPTRTREMMVLVEGPYGDTAPVTDYDSVLLIAGGSGISAVLSYLRGCVASSARHRPRYVRLVWTVRQAAFARSVLDVDLRQLAASAGDALRIDVHVTGHGRGKDHDSQSDWQEARTARVTVHRGRPDAAAIVAEEAADAVGRLAVLACGPARLADDARRAAVRAVGGGHGGLGYFEEQFGR